MHDADVVWAPPRGDRIVLVLVLLPTRRYPFANPSPSGELKKDN